MAKLQLALGRNGGRLPKDVFKGKLLLGQQAVGLKSREPHGMLYAPRLFNLLKTIHAVNEHPNLRSSMELLFPRSHVEELNSRTFDSVKGISELFVPATMAGLIASLTYGGAHLGGPAESGKTTVLERIRLLESQLGATARRTVSPGIPREEADFYYGWTALFSQEPKVIVGSLGLGHVASSPLPGVVLIDELWETLATEGTKQVLGDLIHTAELYTRSAGIATRTLSLNGITVLSAFNIPGEPQKARTVPAALYDRLELLVLTPSREIGANGVIINWEGMNSLLPLTLSKEYSDLVYDLMEKLRAHPQLREKVQIAISKVVGDIVSGSSGQGATILTLDDHLEDSKIVVGTREMSGIVRAIVGLSVIQAIEEEVLSGAGITFGKVKRNTIEEIIIGQLGKYMLHREGIKKVRNVLRGVSHMGAMTGTTSVTEVDQLIDLCMNLVDQTSKEIKDTVQKIHANGTELVDHANEVTELVHNGILGKDTE